MAIRPDFVFEPDRQPTPCNICGGPIETWHLTTFVGAIPVESICAQCATAIAKVVVATPEAHDLIDLDERRRLAQALKGSHTQSLVKQAESDQAIARRLLS